MIKHLGTKLILDFFLFVFFLLTIEFGIFEGTWYIRENEYSEIFNIVWIYGLYNYPIMGLGLNLNMLLSIFFSQGIIIQIIYDQGYDLSRVYYWSLILTFLSLLASLFMYDASFQRANAFYIHETYLDHYIKYSKIILPGFYCGLISVLLIFVKYNVLNHFKRKDKYKKVYISNPPITNQNLAIFR
ncbi:MAG: hypothetical protein ACFFDL_14280 [Promethearchaeota archaeon]